MIQIRDTIAEKFRQVGIYILIVAMVLFAVDMIWVAFFGGVRLEFGTFVLRSTTIEFPSIALLISVFGFLLLSGKWKESILLTISFSIACLGGEVLLRIVEHPLSKPFINANSWQEPSDILGFTMAPNFGGRGPLDVWVKINSQGLRSDVEYEWAKPQDEIRILGIGDSFTFGWGVSLEESFLQRLEHRLHQMTGSDIETINAGVPGWNLNHYYVYLKERGIRYSPDVIVLSYFINDVPNSIQETIPANPKHQRGWEHKGGLFRFSYLFNFVKSFANNIRRKNRFKRIDHLSQIEARWKELAKAGSSLIIDSGEEQTRASSQIIKTLFKKIQFIANQHDSRLIIMLIPDVAQLHQPEMQHINRVLTSITEEMNIAFTDMTPVFESSSDPQTFYFWPKDWHTNALGHEKMAETLTPLICQALQEKNIHCNQLKKFSSAP